MPPSSEETVSRTLTYKIEVPFPYAYKGQVRQAEFVELTGPTSRHRAECAVLKQAFFRSLKELPTGNASAAKDAKPEDISGEDVIQMMYMGSGDMGAVLDAARKLLSGGVALVDGEQKLTAELIDLMSIDDLERMAGDYLAFFTLRSALTRLNAA